MSPTAPLGATIFSDITLGMTSQVSQTPPPHGMSSGASHASGHCKGPWESHRPASCCHWHPAALPAHGCMSGLAGRVWHGSCGAYTPGATQDMFSSLTLHGAPARPTLRTSCLHFSTLSCSFLSCSGLREGSALLLFSREMASFSSLQAAWWAFFAASTCRSRSLRKTPNPHKGPGRGQSRLWESRGHLPGPVIWLEWGGNDRRTVTE